MLGASAPVPWIVTEDRVERWGRKPAAVRPCPILRVACSMNATTVWSHWQGLLSGFARCFTVPGWKRFVEWITALVLNVEEHTITQSVIAVQRIDDWKAMETFAETGAWHSQGVEDSFAQVIETAPGRIWHGFHVSAVDDTKVHRSSPEVWGTCTFHEYTARCPNRAATVRPTTGSFWAVVAQSRSTRLVPAPGRSLYFRKSQLPGGKNSPSQRHPFRTKCELAVELLRAQAEAVGGSHLGSSTVPTPLVRWSGRWSCRSRGIPGSSSSPVAP